MQVPTSTTTTASVPNFHSPDLLMSPPIPPSRTTILACLGLAWLVLTKLTSEAKMEDASHHGLQGEGGKNTRIPQTKTSVLSNKLPSLVLHA